MSDKQDVGLIGLAVMGQNLVLNMKDKGFAVSVWNRTFRTTQEFIKENESNELKGFEKLDSFVNSLKIPRKIFLMVKAGTVVDKVLEQLVPLLDEGDIIMDGGNSHYADTERRVRELKEKKISFIGSGISGGETGARFGPSMMPGGDKDAWEFVKPIIQKISAQYHGEPCADWMGEGGAGHFVKMVHNGIEYGDMQIIAEAYDFLRKGLKFSYKEMSQTFIRWNTGVLESYIIDITAKILEYKENDKYLVDLIMDSAGQKGTGRWTAVSALEQASPATLCTESVFARIISSKKREREELSSFFSEKKIPDLSLEDKELFIQHLEKAVYASKIVSYAQGFDLIYDTAAEYHWHIDLPKVAEIWRDGCIIRSRFLDDIASSFRELPKYKSLLFTPFFQDALQDALPSWRKVVARCIEWGVPVPAMASALTYFDSITSKHLPANLIQAQRDFFGAHTYQRIDRPMDQVFHTDWANTGGKVSSSSYNA